MIIQTHYKMFLVAALLLVGIPVAAQQTNRLLEIERAYHEREISIDDAVMSQLQMVKPNRFSVSVPALADKEVIKCATPLHALVELNRSKLSPEVLAAYDRAYAKNSSSAAVQSYISPSGKFQINYEISGDDSVSVSDANSNGVPDYVEWVAEASDSSYRYEIVEAGFSDPIPDGETYRVDIENVDVIYGETRSSFSEPAGTYIVIENDFLGFPPNTDPDGNQKGAIRATMAHEFKHAVQYRQSGSFSNSRTTAWLEMDATLMEEAVYDEVNDYYNYIDGFGFDLFSSPSRAFTYGSYEHITWALYFHEKLGTGFWKEVWDRLEQNKSTLKFMDAVKDELAGLGLGFEESILELYMWHFASGVGHFNTSFGFDESNLYPSPAITSNFTTLQEAKVDSTGILNFSGRYYQVSRQNPTSGYITISFKISNPQVQFGLIGYNTNGSLETKLITLQNAGVDTTYKTNWKWNELSKIGVVVVNSNQGATENFMFEMGEDFSTGITNPDAPDVITLSQNYPNPFNPETNIPVTLRQSQRVTLSVYDNLGRLVQTVYDGILPAGETTLRFNSAGLPSGVYIYRLESNAGSRVKRMTVVK